MEYTANSWRITQKCAEDYKKRVTSNRLLRHVTNSCQHAATRGSNSVVLMHLRKSQNFQPTKIAAKIQHPQSA